jgi:PKD repeat protein
VFLSTATSASAPNTPPDAAFTFDCFGLDCTFDGVTSTDPDGSIVSYAWDFAGEDTGSGQQAAHTFAAAGTYPVTLTVTDNRTGTDTFTTDVTVTPVDSSIAITDSDAYSGNGKAVHTWAVPAGVQDGDTMLLFVSGSTTAEPSTPTGWTLEQDVLDSDTRTVVFSKTADATDAGAPLEVTWTEAGTNKSTITVMSLAAYSGVASIESIAGTIEGSASARAAHAAPDTTVPADGDWVLSYWSDKNASTTDWTEPFGQQVRAEPVGVGATHVTGLLTDDGAPAAAGARAGLVATANGQATKATMFTVVLASN